MKGTGATPSGESLGTVARVVALLRLLAESKNDLTLTALSERMGLAPSTIHRLMSLLIQEGLVGRDENTKTYYCAAEFVRISSLVLGASRVSDLAGPILQSLADQFDESSMLCLYLEQQRQYTIAKSAHGTQLLRYDIQENKPLSLLWGASARSILAFLPQAHIDEVIAREVSRDEDAAGILADLAATRERGYAFTKGQRVEGSIGLGAPFFNAGGKVVGSVCLTIPRNRFDDAREKNMGAALKANAERLSHMLGYFPKQG